MSLPQLRNNLEYLRQVSGNSATGLSRKLSMSKDMYRHWETGYVVPKTPQLLLLSSFFDLTIDELVRKDLSKKDNPLRVGGY